ncbi:LacI family DNA-binding transcriptional regulator [Alteromonas sp. C1M14]|nr:LacI family DNA-binding transcriptional regulator [Alteromonas sp. C1M14]MBU2978721.1 LacI family DNA-binding transcriptional regulator [Alteromonas sp. C1M14]
MKATIKDVAKLAGVSFKTVSRVINNESNVKAETLEKVQHAINTLNYQPNQAARNLAAVQSYAIGYVYDNPNAYYIIDMQKGLLEACHERNYELLIYPCDASKSNIAHTLLGMISRSKLAGLVLSPPLSEMPEVLAQIAESGVPFVGVVSGDAPDIPQGRWVCIDDRLAAERIVDHLIGLGHKRIGFLSGDHSHRSTLEREQGYLDALAKHGLANDQALRFNGQYAFNSGVAGMKTLLSLPTPPTAVFACNDEIASGALFHARLHGLNVPQQLAIAGFENSPFSLQTWPPITTAAQPTSDIAKQAGDLLISTIQERRTHKDREKPKTPRYFCPELIIRDSTGK